MSDTTEAVPENEAPEKPAEPVEAGSATPVPDAPEATPEKTPESTPEASGDKDARIAELERKLAEAAPIIQAHADAEEQNKSDLQKANERADALEAELTKLRDEMARARVAEKTGLTSDVVALLNGASEEELMKAAETVAKAKPNLHSRSAPAKGSAPSKGDVDEGATDPKKLAEQIRKRMPY